MSHGGVVDVGFDFIADLVGRGVVAAEVDNMARVVRFRTIGDYEDTLGIRPETRERLHEIADAFVTVRILGKDFFVPRSRADEFSVTFSASE